MKRKQKKLLESIFSKTKIKANTKLEAKKLVFLRVNKTNKDDYLGKDYFKIKEKK